MAGRHGVVQQFGDAVQAAPITHLGDIEDQLRPLAARGQVVPREGVDVAGVGSLPGGHHVLSVSRAMINFWTSLAPS
jgi:hypothetical protein